MRSSNIRGVVVNIEQSGEISETMRQLNKVIELERARKLNVNNAFDVDFDNFDVENFLNQRPETKWLRSGEAVHAGGKVYGFRVDNVHNTVYRILGGLNRNAVEEVDVINEEENKESEEKKNTLRKLKFSPNDGLKTLE